MGNFSADLFFPIDMPGVTFTIVAEDGNPVWNVTERDDLLLPPGKRYDVLVTPEKGEYELETIPFDEGFQLLTKEKLADVSVSGDEGESLPVPTSLQDESEVSLADEEIDKRRRFVFSFATEDGQFEAEINGETFDAKRINVAPVLGTTEEWTLVNHSNEDHPFHIHVNDFQVMSVNGKPYDANGLQDIVTIPKSGGEVVIRNQYLDFTGEYVFHCHILAHEDAGMMQTVDVVNPGEKPGFQGTTAAMDMDHGEHGSMEHASP